MEFKETAVSAMEFNPFNKISKQWMLVTAGDTESSNTMTASWGGVGIMWGKPVATVYIRPQRYTKEFIDKNEYFTLSFLPEEYRQALNVCGSVSGRNVADKWQEAGLHPFEIDGTTAVEEAEEVFVCRKLYAQEMLPECFIDSECDTKWYPEKDYERLSHHVYCRDRESIEKINRGTAACRNKGKGEFYEKKDPPRGGRNGKCCISDSVCDSVVCLPCCFSCKWRNPYNCTFIFRGRTVSGVFCCYHDTESAVLPQTESGRHCIWILAIGENSGRNAAGYSLPFGGT